MTLVIFQRSLLKYFLIMKKIGLNINLLQKCMLGVQPVMVGSFSFLFNGTPECQASECLMVPT